MFTRDDYMQNKVTHSDYYNQFVTEEIKRYVEEFFGSDRLRHAYIIDPYLNTIPLKYWDGFALYHGLWNEDLRQKLKVTGEHMSLATRVCILKEAARQIIGGKI